MHYMQNINVTRWWSGRADPAVRARHPLAHVDLEDVTEVAALVVTEAKHQ